MDREKQIEEMADAICASAHYDFCKYTACDVCPIKTFAAKACDEGYIKINEDEVVIKKEEYENIWRKGYEEGYSILVDDTIKKTAEKFVNELRTFIGHLIPSEYSIMDIIIEIENKIYDLAKQFGVEIGDINE